MAHGNGGTSSACIDWKAVAVFIIELIKALRGGAGRFYAYTFAVSMLAIAGAPWWAPLAEYAAAKLISLLPPYEGSGIVLPVAPISPWFVAISGLVFCLLSLYGFHKAHTSSGSIAEAKEGFIKLHLHSGDANSLRDGIETLKEAYEVPISCSNMVSEHLDAYLETGEFEWESMDAALTGLNMLVVDYDRHQIGVEKDLGGYRLSSEEKARVSQV